MATAGTSTHLLRFVTILLMNVCVMDSQGLPEPTDVIVQTDGELKTEKLEYTITLSMTIDTTFDNTLTNKNSQMYQKYSKDITSSVDGAYSGKLSSYKAHSAKVIQFRPGSVVADFTIASTRNTLDFSAANRQLASALRDKGYSVNENSFAQTVENGLYDPSKGNIYPGKNMVLTCNPPALSTGGITWSFNDIIIGSSPAYLISADRKTITVENTSDRLSGKYACTTTLNSVPYIIWQRIVIQPLPNIRVTTSKTVYCDGSPITLECCAENSYMTKWSLFTSSGLQTLTDPPDL
ncbi:adhesion G protein-coupled receptor F5-like [Pygocentrus nattereri]|uniref:adhesion G protein-coupled receptor F5-like n=1 Tax=Pygocentrus nattereri TaxID=42514 RepID=UPI0018910B29|nr:adhesion G protein-coupled receptor F5-like [Pygocentrus nattereri]